MNDTKDSRPYFDLYCDNLKPTIAAFLLEEWEFPTSLREQIKRYGRPLSDRQLQACKNILAKRETSNPQVKCDLQAIRVLFENAVNSGLRKPGLRFAKIKLSLAPASGKNTGALYVKDYSETYLGKVTPDGLFVASRECTPEVKDYLFEIAEDPFMHAVKYGKSTMACSACGRPLTDPESVKRGIGPVCYKRYFESE